LDSQSRKQVEPTMKGKGFTAKRWREAQVQFAG
jgi:hypothetical protein